MAQISRDAVTGAAILRLEAIAQDTMIGSVENKIAEAVKEMIQDDAVLRERILDEIDKRITRFGQDVVLAGLASLFRKSE